MSYFQFTRYQHLKANINELWDFISSPENLKKITPKYMGFDIISDNLPEKMYKGMVIAYKVRPILGLNATWVTEITHVKELEYFVDEQRIGPYKLWHHQHFLIPEKDQVIMKDIVTYTPPFGIIGYLANKMIIRKKLVEIFDYRQKTLDILFNKA
jgi:ligand-binding SRPBCC domain-containing protein